MLQAAAAQLDYPPLPPRVELPAVTLDATIAPALAAAAPGLLDVTGAMNSGGVLIAFILIAATAMIGYVVFGAALWRAGILPRVAALLFLLGGILFNLPPGPVPMMVLTVGGVVWAVGAIWLALTLLKGKGAIADYSL